MPSTHAHIFPWRLLAIATFSVALFGCHSTLYTLPDYPPLERGALPSDQVVTTEDGERVTVTGARVRQTPEQDGGLQEGAVASAHGFPVRIRTRRDRAGTAAWTFLGITAGSVAAFYGSMAISDATATEDSAFGLGFPGVPATMVWTSMLSGLGFVVAGTTWIFLEDGVRPAEDLPVWIPPIGETEPLGLLLRERGEHLSPLLNVRAPVD